MTGIVGFTHACACTCSAQDLGHRPSSAPGALSRPPPSLAALGGSGSKRGASRKLGQWARGSRCWVAAARRMRDRTPGWRRSMLARGCRHGRDSDDGRGRTQTVQVSGGAEAVTGRSATPACRRQVHDDSGRAQRGTTTTTTRGRGAPGRQRDDGTGHTTPPGRARCGATRASPRRGRASLSVASTAAPGAIRLRPRRTPDRPGPIGPAAGPWAGWRSGRRRRAVRRPS